jgi:hypothetical protein
MKNLLVLLPFLALFATSCDHVEDLSRKLGLVDSLGYRHEYLSKEMGKCGTTSKACARFDYKGIQFTKGIGSAAREMVHRDLETTLIRLNGAEATNLQDMIFANLKRYDAFIADFPNYNIPWEWRISVDVNYNKNKLIGVSIITYTYTGGDQGMTNIYFRNYDIQQGNPVTFDSLFVDDYRGQVETLLNAAYKEVIPKEYRNSNLDQTDFVTIFSSNNFRFSDKGLHVLFNNFADSKAPGPYELPLLWSDLKNILLPDFASRFL